ncbi:MAG TPA: cytochrome c [Solirubrobacteraceae bacterium]|jgi:cytochrome c5|nr:cytochrome c [Solirubrobacteraceae bacterium]
MIYAAAAFWIVTAITVFLVALRGGPSAVRASLHETSAFGGRLRSFGVALIFVAGLAIPLVIIMVDNADKAKSGPEGITLTAAETTGRTLFATKCQTCHTLSASHAVGRVGPNLDVLDPPSALVLDAIANGRAEGVGQMPAGLYSGSDATDVAKYIVAVAGK